jgi:hypothetical protein
MLFRAVGVRRRVASGRLASGLHPLPRKGEGAVEHACDVAQELLGAQTFAELAGKLGLERIRGRA